VRAKGTKLGYSMTYGIRIGARSALNPIQAVPAGQVAKADDFSTYESHTSYILRPGTHIFHKTC